MADPNEAVFNNAYTHVVQEVVDTARKSATGHAAQLRKFISQYNEGLYKEMARQGVFLAETTPGILLDNNPYGKPWAPLSTAYADRKLSEGYDGGFYRRKGELANEMFSRSGTADFGPADVVVGAKGVGIDETRYRVDAHGRPRYRAGVKDLAGRAIGGRFAPNTVFRSMVFSIQLTLFTELQGGVPSKGELAFLYPSTISKKLGPGEFGRSKGKGRKQPARPLLRPFIHWYATTNLKNRLFEEFGIKT